MDDQTTGPTQPTDPTEPSDPIEATVPSGATPLGAIPPTDAPPPAPPPPPAAGSAVPPAPMTSTPPAPGTWGTPAPPGMPEAAPPKRRLGLVVALVVLVAIAIVAIIAFTGGSAAGLPDEFGGADRVDSGPMADFVEGFSDAFDDLGVDIEFAIYGGELSPTYMIISMEGEEIGATGGLTDQFQQGFVAGMGAEVDMSQAIEDSEGDVDYLCVPASGSGFGAGGSIGICMYQDGDQLVMVMSLLSDQLNGLLAETKELHADVSG